MAVRSPGPNMHLHRYGSPRHVQQICSEPSLFLHPLLHICRGTTGIWAIRSWLLWPRPRRAKRAKSYWNHLSSPRPRAYCSVANLPRTRAEKCIFETNFGLYLWLSSMLLLKIRCPGAPPYDPRRRVERARDSPGVEGRNHQGAVHQGRLVQLQQLSRISLLLHVGKMPLKIITTAASTARPTTSCRRHSEDFDRVVHGLYAVCDVPTAGARAESIDATLRLLRRLADGLRLGRMMTVIVEVLREFRLVVSQKMTQVLVMRMKEEPGSPPHPPLIIEAEQRYAQTTTFRYLGALLTEHGDHL